MYTWASLASLLMRHPELGPVVRPKLQVTQPNPFISNGRNKSYLIQHFNSTHNLETRPALNTFYKDLLHHLYKGAFIGGNSLGE